MVSAELLSRKLLAFVFLMIPGTHGFGHSCPKDGTIRLTGEDPDSSGFVNKSGILFPWNSTWSMDNETLGCICDFKICMSSCCPVESATDTNGCVAEESSIFGYRGFGDNDEDLFVIGGRCNLPKKELASLMSDDYVHLDNLSLYVKKLNDIHHPEHYCIHRKPNSTLFVTFICYETVLSSETRTIIIFVCYVTVILFLLPTVIVYSVIPVLRNFQGCIVLNCIASYIASKFILLMFLARNLWEMSFGANVLIAADTVRVFSDFACCMWLNVMSFDIWKKFRTIQSIQKIDVEKRQRTRLIRYMIYVWSTSAVRAAIDFFWSHLPIDSYSLSKAQLRHICIWVLPYAIVFISNIFFYAMTAVKIERIKKETAHMVGVMNKHHQENQKWFNLNLKLFIMAGCPMVLWAVSNVWHNEIFMLFVIVTEIPECIFVFLMTVWKDDVKKSIRQLFPDMLRKLGCCRRRDSTPVVRNNNETLSANSRNISY